ncbi:MAG: NUDIX hydrolase, partial [Owenweeksia sp.]
FDNEKLNVLLIEQKLEKGKSQLALPGDLILDDEGLDEAAYRVLKELTQLEGIFLKQFKTFGNPDRVSDIKDLEWLQSYREHPQARVITVAYLSLVKMGDFEPAASSFAERVFWCDLKELPSLAFDHNEILDTALYRLKEDFENKKTGFELLPERFTLSHIQKLYEIILGKKLDKRNFRKKILKEKLVTPTDEKQQGVLHKPARLYEVNPEELMVQNDD